MWLCLFVCLSYIRHVEVQVFGAHRIPEMSFLPSKHALLQFERMRLFDASHLSMDVSALDPQRIDVVSWDV